MPDNPSPTLSETSPTTPPWSITTPSWRWGISLFVAALAAWALLNFPPIQFHLSDELAKVNMYSPQDLQKTKAEKEVVLYWQNGLTRFGIVGICFGAVVLLTTVGAGKRWIPVLSGMLGIVTGIGCGCLAFLLGTYLRRYFDSDVPLPLVDENNRALVADASVYVSISVLLVLPVMLTMLVGGGARRGHNAFLILLAALVAGLLTPLTSLLFAYAPDLFGLTEPNIFPPTGLALTGAWLAILAVLVFVFTTFTGPRSPRVKSGEPEGAA